ncbi:uncharacterized protein LAESUDRAFT_663607 [Laetiporus sulphureus 93-53]|uniref:Uncharacterized protein n=1 Tax=Laetiporus sulphureus 93-53 TaxID=1314785 RepID=A0A165BSP9_9APHY|nr:uncharacterized protein LAESUDRAFT_663607 [Laetiporus sulphureus 93-53]KZT01578.1 hypothetical protein LAESUDRAFT_663607 [Laetiporus sulphureus 93-53]
MLQFLEPSASSDVGPTTNNSSTQITSIDPVSLTQTSRSTSPPIVRQNLRMAYEPPSQTTTRSGHLAHPPVRYDPELRCSAPPRTGGDVMISVVLQTHCELLMLFHRCTFHSSLVASAPQRALDYSRLDSLEADILLFSCIRSAARSRLLEVQ